MTTNGANPTVAWVIARMTSAFAALKPRPGKQSRRPATQQRPSPLRAQRSRSPGGRKMRRRKKLGRMRRRSPPRAQDAVPSRSRGGGTVGTGTAGTTVQRPTRSSRMSRLRLRRPRAPASTRSSPSRGGGMTTSSSRSRRKWMQVICIRGAKIGRHRPRSMRRARLMISTRTSPLPFQRLRRSRSRTAIDSTGSAESKQPRRTVDT